MAVTEADIDRTMKDPDVRQKRRGIYNALILALAAGQNVPSAAQAAGVSTPTVYRRLKCAAFRQRIAEVRERMLQEAVGRLLTVSVGAIYTLARSLKSKNETLRIRAANDLLTHMFKGMETVDLAARVARMEAGQQSPSAVNLGVLVDVHGHIADAASQVGATPGRGSTGTTPPPGTPLLGLDPRRQVAAGVANGRGTGVHSIGDTDDEHDGEGPDPGDD